MTDESDAVAVLARAGTVAFGGVGIAGAELPETAAFHAMVAAGDGGRADVERLLADGTPAARIYAASALQEWDPAAAAAVWRRLAADPAEVTVMTGCLADRTTVGAYATDVLSRGVARP